MATSPDSPLPPLYAAWISELLGGTPPSETRATCDDCVMCNKVAPEATSYNPETKCCTYLPVLPNFLVGQVLEDDDPAGEPGRASMRARIAKGAAVTPIGLGVPNDYGLLYGHGGTRTFGQSIALRCPHYIEEGGRCGIWRQRNSVCATWFCKHVRGEVGFVFWQRVRELLIAIERDLAQWCILQLGMRAEVIAKALPQSARPGADRLPVEAAELDGRRDPLAAAAHWGAWIGRELDLYRACAAFVAPLTAADVLRVCGPEVSLRVEVLRAAFLELTKPDPPERMRVGPLVLLRTTRTSQRVGTYSALDPLEMPRELFDVLHHFDGRTTDEARASILTDGGPRLSAGLVRKLADFGVLVP